MANITLGVGYVIGSILVAASFSAKLHLAAMPSPVTRGVPDRFAPANGFHRLWNLCYRQQATNDLDLDREICQDVKQGFYMIFVFDTANRALFHILFIIADALLIYRCYAMHRRQSLMTGLAAAPLFAALGYFSYAAILAAKNIRGTFDPLANPVRIYGDGLLYGSYISLATNLIVSSTLITKLWKAKREAERLLDDPGLRVTQIPYSNLIAILLQSALPPLVLGLSHLIAWLGFMNVYGTHGSLWVSFTVLAPQTIAVQVMRRRHTVPSNKDTETHCMQTMPIKFNVIQSHLSCMSMYRSTSDAAESEQEKSSTVEFPTHARGSSRDVEGVLRR